ncbi:MAG: DUF4368 domain-containing protein, partial [Evtepia sp.]
EEWCVFPDHHEPLISVEVFETVQRLRRIRRKISYMGDLGALNGLLVCGTCGDNLRIQHDVKKDHAMYLCRNYANAVSGGTDHRCTRHSINRKIIERLVLEELHRVTESARRDKAKFIQVIRSEKDKECERTLKSKTTQLAKSEKRIAELDTIITRVYEDHVGGRLSDDRFAKMLSSYENEQATLEKETAKLGAEVEAAREKADGIDKFLKLCAKYTDLTELSAEVARSFIEKIVVHEAVKEPGRRYKKQSQEIEIHFSFIGEFPKEQAA